MSNIIKLTPYVYLTERTDLAEGEKRYDLFLLVPVDAAGQTDVDFTNTAAAYPGIPDRILIDYATVPHTTPPAGVKYRFHYLAIDKKRGGVLYNTLVIRGDGLLTKTLLVDFDDADTNTVATIPANFQLNHVPYVHLQKETVTTGTATQNFVRPSSIILFDSGNGVVSETITLLNDNCLHELTIGSTTVVTSDPDNFQINQDFKVEAVTGAFFESSVGGPGGGGRRKKPKVKNLNANGGGSMPPTPPDTVNPKKTLVNGTKPATGKAKTTKKKAKPKTKKQTQKKIYPPR